MENAIAGRIETDRFVFRAVAQRHADVTQREMDSLLASGKIRTRRIAEHQMRVHLGDVIVAVESLVNGQPRRSA